LEVFCFWKPEGIPFIANSLSKAFQSRFLENPLGGMYPMGTVDKQGGVTMQELPVSSPATSDPLTRLFIE